MLKKNYLVLMLVFILFNLISFGQSKGFDYYYEKLSTHKEVKELGSISMEKDFIIIQGMVYDKVRLDKVIIKDNEENSGEAEITVLVKDIEQGFLKKNDEIKSIKVTTTDNSLIAEGRAKLMGRYFGIRVEGFFTVENGDLNCLLTNAKLGYLKMPKWIVNKFNKKLNPFFEVKELGMTIKTSEIVFEEDRVIIK